MIITIAGRLGSGKSTLAKIVAKKLGLKHYSTGDFYREIARKRGVTPLELAEIAKHDKSVDKMLDERQVKLGKEEDDFVIDARLGWFFIPNSIKIFLDVSQEEGARRIFSQKRKDEKENTSLEKTMENIRKREESEHQRYEELYKADYLDLSNYDLVVDTTNIPIDGVAKKVVEFIKRKTKRKPKLYK